MKGTDHKLDELLGSVLRGVNKVVGCNSTNLVVISEKTGYMRVQVGVRSDDYPVMSQLEETMGETFQGLAVPLQAAEGSMLSKVWSDGQVRETSSLAEMISAAIPTEILDQFEQIAGERSYLVVPASGATRKYGVLLFEKQGKQSFTRQQREVLMRYARRIGDLIENDIKGQGALLPSSGSKSHTLLFDGTGHMVGASLGEVTQSLEAEDLSGPVSSFIDQGTPVELSLSDGRKLSLESFSLNDQPAAMGTLSAPVEPGLSAMENQLLQLTLGIPAPAIFVDSHWGITSLNPAAERMLGQSGEQLVGQAIRSLFEEADLVEQFLERQALLPDNPVAGIRAILHAREGSLVPVQLEALLLADDRDQAIGQLLSLRPAEGDQALTTQKIIQQERLATMGEMAAQLAHEIRNPLVAIGATLESLGRETGEKKRRDLLNAATGEIDRMDMILRKYLTGRHDLALRQVQLHDLVEDVRRLIQGARKSSGKNIQLDLPGDLRVVADYDAMKQVVFNLMLNALEAVGPGGQVTCSSQSTERTIALLIDDDGPGLSSSADECFQPFFTTKSNGTGLGLPVCQKVVLAHGGTLELSNNEQGGCRATVLLPRRNEMSK